MNRLLQELSIYKSLYYTYKQHICRITSVKPGRTEQQRGIALLIGTNILLTAYHILEEFINNQNNNYSLIIEFLGAKEIRIESIEQVEVMRKSPYPDVELNPDVDIDILAKINLDYTVIKIPSLEKNFKQNKPPYFFCLKNYQFTHPETDKKCLILPFPENENRSLDSFQGSIKECKSSIFYYDINTEKGFSGAPIFSLDTGHLIGIHRGKFPIKIKSEISAENYEYVPYGTLLYAIINDLKDYSKEAYKVIMQPSKDRKEQFPIILNNTPVIDRRFIESMYHDLIDHKSFHQFVNIIGPSDSGKSFCRDIIQQIWRNENNESVKIHIIDDNQIKTNQLQSPNDIIDCFDQLMRNICSSFYIHPPSLISKDESKYNRIISESITEIYRSCSNNKDKHFILLIDSEQSLVHGMASLIIQTFVTYADHNQHNNIKIILFSIKLIEEYKYFQTCCSHKDFKRKSRQIKLDEHPVKFKDLLDCLDNLVKSPKFIENQFFENMGNNIKEFAVTLIGQQLLDGELDNYEQKALPLREISDDLTSIIETYQ